MCGVSVLRVCACRDNCDEEDAVCTVPAADDEAKWNVAPENAQTHLSLFSLSLCPSRACESGNGNGNGNGKATRSITGTTSLFSSPLPARKITTRKKQKLFVARLQTPEPPVNIWGMTDAADSGSSITERKFGGGDRERGRERDRKRERVCVYVREKEGKRRDMGLLQRWYNASNPGEGEGNKEKRKPL